MMKCAPYKGLSCAHRYKEKVALLFIDPDALKSVNDSIGHNMGDLLLQAVERRLEGCLRKSDTIARTGGDELIKKRRRGGVLCKKKWKHNFNSLLTA